MGTLGVTFGLGRNVFVTLTLGLALWVCACFWSSRHCFLCCFSVSAYPCWFPRRYLPAPFSCVFRRLFSCCPQFLSFFCCVSRGGFFFFPRSCSDVSITQSWAECAWAFCFRFYSCRYGPVLRISNSSTFRYCSFLAA